MRITIKQLEMLVDRINDARGTPAAPYTNVDGKLKANVDNFHIDQAYGGCSLVQMVNENGGVRTISPNGFGTKRELYTFLQGMLA